ncbi:HNH nuclease, partial [Vibrio phage 1.110.O._10N.261.52.C1]
KYDFEALNEVLLYNKNTGEISWKDRNGTPGSKSFNSKYAGRAATNLDRGGYLGVSIGGEWFVAHRVAWVLHYGSINEELHVDHVNHDRADNRISNLRMVDRGVNSKNRSPSSNTKYCLGVSFRKNRGKFQAKISSDGRTHYLGTFGSLLDACCARKSAEISMGFHENHGK